MKVKIIYIQADEGKDTLEFSDVESVYKQRLTVTIVVKSGESAAEFLIEDIDMEIEP